jgi:hypothetical protein
MRKIICILIITGSMLVSSPATNAKSKKAPKKLSAVQYAALEKRINEATDTGRREFMKEKPDIDAELKVIAPAYRNAYRADLEKQIASARRAYETRSIPVDVRRIISVKVRSRSEVLVDRCYVTSISFSDTPLQIDSGAQLVGSRDQQQWILIKGVWFKGAQTIGPLLSRESECSDAR